jgi:hypothetical protein
MRFGIGIYVIMRGRSAGNEVKEGSETRKMAGETEAQRIKPGKCELILVLARLSIPIFALCRV